LNFSSPPGAAAVKSCTATARGVGQMIEEHDVAAARRRLGSLQH